MTVNTKVGLSLIILISLVLFYMQYKKHPLEELTDLTLRESFAFENFDGRRPVKYLFIHCSGSNSKTKMRGTDIMRVAKERGFLRPPYHYFIPREKYVDTLCKLNNNCFIDPEEVCWGVAGVNSIAIHVCIEGCFVDKEGYDHRTAHQKLMLELITNYWKLQCYNIIIQGHNEYPGVKKACPGFKASKEYGGDLIL